MRGPIGLCFLLLNFVIVPLSAAQSAESDEAEANPGRPTVSTPATLTPVGYLQFETGVLVASHSPEFSSRYGFNEVMKLSVTPRLEFMMQMPSSTSKLKRWCIESSSARHFPFHILSSESSRFRVKFGTLRNLSWAAMPLGIFGQ